jgi:hypothetical protein
MQLRMMKINFIKTSNLLAKLLAGILIFLVVIFFLVKVILLIPTVQSKLKNKLTSTFYKRLNTEVSIGKIDFRFPKKVTINDFFISGNKNDTLAFIGEFSVSAKLFPLLNHQIVLNHIGLKNSKSDIAKLLDQLQEESPETPVEETSESNPWQIDINALKLKNCIFTYRDNSAEGFELILEFGKVIAKFGYLNFDTLINFTYLETENSFVSYQELSIVETSEDSTFSFADIRVDKSNLQNSAFSYIDSIGGVIVNVKGGKVSASDLLVDITTDAVTLDKASIDGFFVETNLLAIDDTLPETNDYLNWGESLTDWNFEGNELKMKDIRVRIESLETPDPMGYFNSDHLDFNHLTGTLSNFKLAKDTLNAEFENLSGMEMNGLEVLQLDADIKTTPSEFQINYLKFKTPSAGYNIKLLTTLSPTNYIDRENKTFDFTLEIDGKTWHDMDYFYPFLEKNSILIRNFIKNPFQIKTRIRGKTEDLALELLDFKYLDETRIQASGKVKNITNSEQQEFELKLKNLYVTKKDIDRTFLASVPDSVFMYPKFLRLNGQLNGKSTDLHFTGNINSSNGTIHLNKLLADLGENQKYTADISVDLKNLNEIINYDIDRVKLYLNGSYDGSEIYSTVATTILAIDTITYLKHPYNNITLTCNLTEGNFVANLNSLDSCLTSSANLTGDFHENDNNVQLKLTIQNLDLKKLNLSEDDFRLEGNSVVSTDYTSFDDFKASLKLNNLNFYFADTTYQMHPIAINCSSDKQETRLKLESFFYHLDFYSLGPWQKMAAGIANLPQLYLNPEVHDTIRNTIPDFKLNGNLEYPHAFARLFFPYLPSFKSLSINGNYSQATDEFNFGFKIPGLQKDIFSSDTLIFSLNGTSKELDFNGLAYLNFNDALNGKLNISGNISDLKINSSLRYFDSYSGKFMDLNTLLWSDSSNYFVHFIPDSLTFNYGKWEMNPDNLASIGNNKMCFSEFNLRSGNQKISISSGAENNNDFIHLKLQDFSMENIRNILALDTFVYGTASADFTFMNIFANPEINGRLAINNMVLYDFNFGNLEISRFHYGINKLNYTLSILGEQEDIQSSGNLNFNPGKESMDIDFDINMLDLKELDYLLAKKITNPKGNLKARLKLSGTTESTVVNGSFNFNDAGMGVKTLNEYFTLGNSHVAIENNRIHLNNLNITNQNGTTARVNGTVSLDQKSRMMSNLTISTDNMELLNTTEKDNKVYFGFLKAQTNIFLTGNTDKLKVDTRTKIDKNTRLTYIFPNALTLNDSKGIVSFDPYSEDSIDFKLYENDNEKLKSLALESLKANLEVESGTQFKIYFNENKSDYLDAVLNGNVNYVMDGDNSDISGVMSIVEGKLRYSIPIVSVKDYTIEQGSSITISNDIYNPYLNLIASTTVRASTQKLIQDYVKVMNFTVLLKMSGELNNLKLEFDISSETDDFIVSSKLAQLSAEERNINALNLLVRGSFTFTLKSDEVGSTSTSDAAIDKFYTEQLNHIISDNINFVDVNFDVQSFSDYGNYGEPVHRRNYYYNIGKSFFNNRAFINYKGSFDFADGQETQSLNTQFLQNELNFEIGLTNDGSLKALFFNRNKYEGILEGKVVETGGGLELQKSYYSFSDIFDGNQEKKEKYKKSKRKSNKNK